MTPSLDRRQFLRTSAGAAIAGSLWLAADGRAGAEDAHVAPGFPETSTGEHRGRIFKSIKFGMFQENIPIVEKFRLLKEMGYDGVELNSPGGENKEEALAARRETGLPIHGAVDTVHWGTRLSDPNEETREKALAALLTAIEETNLVGGSAVLLVPGVVDAQVSQDECWHRSIEGIRKALPTAARLGVRILIENVWNRFCYDHDGPADQTADLLAQYIDAIDSPWVGVYFDIGNHRKYGDPAAWIRRLGARIVKLDVKDWGGPKKTFTKIGEGDVDWADVRRALRSIGFTGWSTAEVQGGDRKRIAEVANRMDRALGL